MINISDKWITLLDKLSVKDYVKLTKAIFRDEDEPEISAKHQWIADEIYSDIKRREQLVIAKRKQRQDVDSQQDGQQDSQQDGQQEEKEKGISSSSPLSSPSSLSPDPYSITPYNPPTNSFPEKEKGDDTSSGRACACEGDGGTAEVAKTVEMDEDAIKTAKKAEKKAKEKAKKEAKEEELKNCFEVLWQAYPLKAGKQDAFKKYKSAIKDGATDEQILAGIERYKELIQREMRDKEHILYGSTYFSQRRWEDVYDVPEHQLTPDEEREYQEIWGG